MSDEIEGAKRTGGPDLSGESPIHRKIIKQLLVNLDESLSEIAEARLDGNDLVNAQGEYFGGNVEMQIGLLADSAWAGESVWRQAGYPEDLTVLMVELERLLREIGARDTDREFAQHPNWPRAQEAAREALTKLRAWMG